MLENPAVDEARRFCGRCGEPVGRSRDGAPGRPDGFCRSCGARFSFAPKLRAGDLVGGQYEVVGCLAHGGMGWVYLARDHNVSERWVVLKGLLNRERRRDDRCACRTGLPCRGRPPDIVKIHNFVQHGSAGYIVMEYVGGMSLQRHPARPSEANGGTPSLPVAQAIAYILEILPAFGHLHDRGLLFCDFKLDNVIQTEHSLKLIDLGGVYRIGDASSPIYGTPGYQAPEIAQAGPTVASDLYTVGARSRFCASTSRATRGGSRPACRSRTRSPARSASTRCTASSPRPRRPTATTASNPQTRWPTSCSASYARSLPQRTGRPWPRTARSSRGDLRADPARADWRRLPVLRVATDDPAAGYLATLSATEPASLVDQLRQAPVQTVEVALRLVRALTEAGEWRAAHDACAAIEAEDPWEWRAAWARGVACLAERRAGDAVKAFGDVYGAIPGELAAKLALGIAHELAGAPEQAMRWYETVAVTDPSYTTAAFGLARCRVATGDRAGALAAYDHVLPSSSSHEDAQIAKVDLLAGPRLKGAPDVGELRAAESTLESLTLDPERHARLAIKLLLAALAVVDQLGSWPGPESALLGVALTERDLRAGLERGYRTLAHVTEDPGERIRLVDRANDVRPTTWT